MIFPLENLTPEVKQDFQKKTGQNSKQKKMEKKLNYTLIGNVVILKILKNARPFQFKYMG